MAQPYPPRPGGHVQSPPTEVSYSAYSPSPSSLDAMQHRYNRIHQWTNHLPPRPGADTPPDTWAAKSATWRDDLDTVNEEGNSARPYPQQREHLQPPSSANARSHPQQPRSPAPSPHARGPPVPLLAQNPRYAPQPELSRGEHLARSPSFHPKAPTPLRSARSAREAYLNSALELPLDMLNEVAAPDEVFDQDCLPRPSRMGTIMSRARSTVSLKTSAASQPAQPSPERRPPVPDPRARVTSHSQPTPYSRRQSQQSLRSVPEMSVLPKLVTNARPPDAGPGPDVRPGAAQSPTPSFEDSKCSSMQTSSESEYSIAKADSRPSAQPIIVNFHADELNITASGVTARGVAMQAGPVLTHLPPGNPSPIQPSQLSRRTTSRAHCVSQPTGTTIVPDGRMEQLSTTPDGHTRNGSVRTDRRPPLLKSASVDGHITSAVRRAPSSASERTASDHGLVFTQSSAPVDNVQDRGDRITFSVPSNRRGKLHVSLAWLPGRSRSTQSQPLPQRTQSAVTLTANPVADRRASLQTMPTQAAPALTRRRSQSVTDAPPTSFPQGLAQQQSHVPPPQMYPAGAPMIGGIPPQSRPIPPPPSLQQHLPPGAMPLHGAPGPRPQQVPSAVPVMAVGYSPHAPSSASLPAGVHPAPPPSGLQTGAQISGVPRPGLHGYPVQQPMYGYPGLQPPMPPGGWHAYAGHAGRSMQGHQMQPVQSAPGPLAPASQHLPKRQGIGRGTPPASRPLQRAATGPTTSKKPGLLNIIFSGWGGQQNPHADTFMNRPAPCASVPMPAAAPKTARFATPVIAPGQLSKKEESRLRRTERRDARERRRSGARVGVNI